MVGFGCDHFFYAHYAVSGHRLYLVWPVFFFSVLFGLFLYFFVIFSVFFNCPRLFPLNTLVPIMLLHKERAYGLVQNLGVFCLLFRGLRVHFLDLLDPFSPPPAIFFFCVFFCFLSFLVLGSYFFSWFCDTITCCILAEFCNQQLVICVVT